MNNGKTKKIVLMSICISAIILIVSGIFLKGEEGKQVGYNVESNDKKEINLNFCNVSKDETTTAVFESGVNGKNEPGYDGANEGEVITVDAFFLANERVFLDDTVNNRILVYNSNFAHKF